MPSVLGVVWVAAVALLSTIFAIYSLSAFQVQVRIQSFSSKGLSYSIWNIDRLTKRQDSRERDIEPLELELKKLQAQVAAGESRLSAVQAKYWEQSAQLDNLLYRLLARIKEKDATFDDKSIGYGYEKFSRMRAKLQELGVADAVQATLASYETLYAEADKTSAERYALEQQLAVMSEETKKRTEALLVKREEVENFLTEEDPILRNQILDFASEIRVLDSQLGFLRVLTRIPNEMLLLLLMIAMGLLGSSIYLMRGFFGGGPELTLRIVFFRQFLGALTALMMFVVVKAGVLVASDPRTAAQSGTLNPFLLAFLGIIAGLMSEQVVERISQYGREWLRDTRLGSTRFARGVRAEIDAQKKAVDDLAKFFDGKKQLVEAWLSETEPVPPGAQSIIAAWLNKPERDLFSDLPKAAPPP